MSDAIEVFEVGPRDGLQNETFRLPFADKVWLLEGLSRAGVRKIEAGAFVRPDRVPQMSDSGALSVEIQARRISGRFYFLVPNETGLRRAIEAGAKEIAVFTAASESFNQKNIGMTIAQSLDQIRSIVGEASTLGIPVRGYVSTAWGCPFEGRVKASAVIEIVEHLLQLPLEQVSIGDTIGVASARGVSEVISPLMKGADQGRLAVHFHDTRGSALANALRSFELGVRTFDSSLGGLGGCPFAPGASGNLASEDLVYFFKEMGIETGVDYPELCRVSLELAKRMGKTSISSRALQAFQSNCNKNNPWDS